MRHGLPHDGVGRSVRETAQDARDCFCYAGHGLSRPDPFTPDPLTVATARQVQAVFDRAGGRVPSYGRLPYKPDDVERHRRVNLDREPAAWRADPLLADLTEACEAELRREGLIAVTT